MFVKYPKIETSVGRRSADGQEWILTEKVHGANFSMMVSNNDRSIHCFKRTGPIYSAEDVMDRVRETHIFPHVLLGVLAEFCTGDFFYYHERVVKREEKRVWQLFEACKKRDPTTTQMTVYGELFGGAYPHKDVAPVPEIKKPVQVRIYYASDVHFMAFDMRTDSKSFLPYADAMELFEQVGMLFAEPLARNKDLGVLLRQFDLERFPSTIPLLLRLPPLPFNTIEGFVYRTLTGPRHLIKRKSKRFEEVEFLGCLAVLRICVIHPFLSSSG